MMIKSMTPKKHTAIISLITAICLLGDSMLYLVLPIYWKDFGLDAIWQVGILLAVNRVIRLPFNPIATWCFATIGQRKCTLIAICLAIGTTFSYSYATGFWALFIARSLWGIAWNFLRLGAYFSIVQISTVFDRGHHMGIYNGIFRLGSLFGMLGGALIAELFNPLLSGYIFSFCGLFAFPLALVLIPDTEFSEKKQNIKINVNLIQDKLLKALIVSSFFSAMIYQGMFTSMLSYLTDYMNFKFDFLVVLGLGTASTAGVLQSIRWTWEPYLAPKIGLVSDGKRGRRKMLNLFLVLGAILFLFISYEINAYIWFVAILLLQVTGTGITTLVDAIAGDVASSKNNSSSIMSIHSFCIDFGSALGPIIGYSLNSYFNIHTPFIFAGFILAFLAAFWFRIDSNLVR